MQMIRITGILPLFILFFAITQHLSAQSLSGNVSSLLPDRDELAYATVNIYKDGKLVKNVLTDMDGNFNVKLDSGTYKCEIIYAGFKKTTKKIRVTSDEKEDFVLDTDKESKYLSLTKEEVFFSSPDVAKTKTYSIASEGIYSYPVKTEKDLSLPSTKARETIRKYSGEWNYGRLTAGEINDFSKWDLWGDLTSGELGSGQNFWHFSPKGRYTIQVKGPNGIPVANAKVELIDKEKILFTARTDNTGRAELWEEVSFPEQKGASPSSIKIYHDGKIKTLRKIRKFDQGINTVIVDAPCSQSENVDIAIVVDATGSMQDEIDYLKSDLNRVIFRSKEISTTMNFRFANIFYRDLGDDYVTSTQNFTGVLSESVAFTSSHNAAGGGDGPEAMEVALDSAVNSLKWREDTRAKLLFLVLDAPPHNTPEIREKLTTLIRKAAEKGIRIIPVTGSGINKNTEFLMRCMALATNGTYTFLTDNSGIGNPHLEPSTDNYEVEILNDLLVRIIKSFTYMPDCNQEVADLGIDFPDSQVVVKGPNENDSLAKDTTGTITPRQQPIEINWKYYPNPTHGIFHILANRKIHELYISDLGGKVLKIIRDIEADRPTLANISDFSSGIYLIRYLSGKKWISGKIILVHN